MAETIQQHDGSVPSDVEAPPEPRMYERAWQKAQDVTLALSTTLQACGFTKDDFPYLRADVNVFGNAMVCLGRVSPDVAARLADLLQLGGEVARRRPSPRTPERTSGRAATRRLGCRPHGRAQPSNVTAWGPR